MSKAERKSTQIRQVTFTVFSLSRKYKENVPGAEEKVELFLTRLGEKRVTFPFTDSNVEFRETMWESYLTLKDVRFDIFCAERNAKEMMFIQPPSTGYNAVYIKTIINQRRLYVRQQISLMNEELVHLENDNMEKIKEIFSIF